jgi:hypothetical protein
VTPELAEVFRPVCAPRATGRRLVIIDLDRTALDTARLRDAIGHVLYTELGIYPDKFREEVRRFTSETGYDLFGHLETLGFGTAAAELLLRDRLQGQDFMFPDARRLLDELLDREDLQVVFLTVGVDRYQQFKLSLLPEKYRQIPATVIGYNKGVWLMQLWEDGVLTYENETYEEAVVIDDKASTLLAMANAPASVQLVHVLRPEAKYQQRCDLDRVVTVSQLALAA